MELAAITPRPSGWQNYQLEDVRDQLNAMTNDIATALSTPPLSRTPWSQHARNIAASQHALREVSGHDGRDDAALAAREVLPRLSRIALLVDALHVRTIDQHDVDLLLLDLGAAMDRIERVLNAAGFD